MREATPRPWVSEGLQVWPAHDCETFVADCFRGRDQETEEANAALIVRAVNNYDDALALLREAQVVLHGESDMATEATLSARIDAFLAKENSNG